ncbi:hypothetical protein [Blastococcus mobilis]|uniref:Uncharacterized protein n=1 Tax=Blastococcus mobilis TaxID=1938746 RepID=A0A238VZK2_9ACTN|nr:hypothetical protein [Blastococcus mobilis]SNR39601.1 hypothetical protein SAMN06272737_105195 [Blastococcus mobilis]
MTTTADDSAAEEAFEALLTGRPVPFEAAGLAAFTEAVRASATRPGRPNAALAELLATGLLTDQSEPSTRTAGTDGSPPARRGARVRNRRRFAMIFPALLAKIISAGAVAQADTGAGVVVVAVTGAGVVGVLPDPVQDTVASVVETVTPLDIEGGDEVAGDEVPGEDQTGTTDPGTVPTPVVETAPPAEPTEAEFSAETWALEGPDAYPSFGAWVSAGTHHDVAKALGVRFGELVSSRAREKGLDAEELAAAGVDLGELTGATPTAAPEAEQETTVATRETASGERGSGGNGNGNGNAVAGSNGNAGNGKAAAGNGAGSNGNGGKGNGRD